MRKDKKKRLQRIAGRRNERKMKQQGNILQYTGELLSGRISINPHGFGFVRIEPADEENPADDWFVPAKYLAGAMDGDTVRIAPLPADPRYRSGGQKTVLRQWWKSSAAPV